MNLLNFRVFGMMAFVSLFFAALNFSYLSVSETKSGVSKILSKEIFSLVTITGFLVYLMIFFGTGLMTAFIISILPALLFYAFLLRPFLKENKIPTSIRLNIFYFVTATVLNGFFIYSFLKHTNVLQVFSWTFDFKDHPAARPIVLFRFRYDVARALPFCRVWNSKSDWYRRVLDFLQMNGWHAPVNHRLATQHQIRQIRFLLLTIQNCLNPGRLREWLHHSD